MIYSIFNNVLLFCTSQNYYFFLFVANLLNYFSDDIWFFYNFATYKTLSCIHFSSFIFVPSAVRSSSL